MNNNSQHHGKHLLASNKHEFLATETKLGDCGVCPAEKRLTSTQKESKPINKRVWAPIKSQKSIFAFINIFVLVINTSFLQQNQDQRIVGSPREELKWTGQKNYTNFTNSQNIFPRIPSYTIIFGMLKKFEIYTKFQRIFCPDLPIIDN